MLEVPITAKILPMVMAGMVMMMGIVIPMPQPYTVSDYDRVYIIVEKNVELVIQKDTVEITAIYVRHDDGVYVWDKEVHPDDISSYLNKSELEIINKWEWKIENIDTDEKADKFLGKLYKKRAGHRYDKGAK